MLQTHTGDYNGAGYPFHCQPISNRTDAVKLDINGSLSTDDPELQAGAFFDLLLLIPGRRSTWVDRAIPTNHLRCVISQSMQCARVGCFYKI